MKLNIGKYQIQWSLDGVEIYRVSANTLEKALAHNQEVLLQNPNDGATRFALANVLRMQGRVQEARNEYARVAQSDSPWAESAAQMVAQLEAQPDRPQRHVRALHYVWSTPFWRPSLTWRRWNRLVKKRLNKKHFTPEASNLSRAIQWVLQQEGGMVAYHVLLQELEGLTQGTTIVWSQTEINNAIYALWKQCILSSPGVRWLPQRPASIDGIFDDPAWHTMTLSLINQELDGAD